MKKILSLILALIMIFSLVACAKVDSPDETEEETAQATKTEPKQQETEITKGNSAGVFAVGFSRKDITPILPTPLGGYAGAALRLSKSVKTKVTANCTAIKDADENTALTFAIDICSISEKVRSSIIGVISRSTGVPEGNIMLSASHTHEAPTILDGSSASASTEWTKIFYKALLEAAKDAVADLDKAEMFTNTINVPDLNYIRRFINADGTYSSSSEDKSKAVAFESKIDDELQVIEFKRESKVPVVLVNWRAHPCHDSGETATVVSADYIHYMREQIEKKGCHCTFYQGAAGNVGSDVSTQIPKTSPVYAKRRDAETYGVELAENVLKAMENMTKIETGKVKILSKVVTINVDHSEDSKATLAKQVADLKNANRIDDARKKATELGFDSMWHGAAVYAKSTMEKTRDMTIWAISIGDAAFVYAPYEMFDMTGRDIKNASPFKQTFICELSNSSWSYFPAAECFPHRGYEVCQFRYECGTAEKLRDAFIDMLKELNG